MTGRWQAVIVATYIMQGFACLLGAFTLWSMIRSAIVFNNEVGVILGIIVGWINFVIFEHQHWTRGNARARIKDD